MAQLSDPEQITYGAQGKIGSYSYVAFICHYNLVEVYQLKGILVSFGYSIADL